MNVVIFADLEPSVKEFSINLYPNQQLLNAAFKDMMTFLNWTKVAIIYEEDYGESKNNAISLPVNLRENISVLILFLNLLAV